MVVGRPQTCERIRGSISAAIDGELSEFESILLQAHLAGCNSCREFDAATRASTTMLRVAPLEPLARPVGIPSRRRRPAFRVPAAAAAAAVLMVAFGVFESMQGGTAIRGSRPSQAVFDNQLDMLAIAKRQKQANFQQLLIRRAQFESNQIPRHAGFQP
jgi:predicted anti-sigma-YlaC factor YlaD